MRTLVLGLVLGCAPQGGEAPVEVHPEAESPVVSPVRVEPGLQLRAGTVITHPAAEALAVYDADGDGSDELFSFSAGVARWAGRQQELGGVFQQADAGQLIPGGGEELVVATGIGRGLRAAPARVWLFAEGEPQLLWERKGERDQITELRIVDGRIWLSVFTDSWVVAGGWLDEGQFTPRVQARLGMAQLPLEDDRVLVGRLYGDEPKSPGMLVLDEGGTERVLPSRRGVRSLFRADLDGDGLAEVLFGDGWHHAYGEHGLARLVVIPGTQALEEAEPRTLAVLDGDYTINGIDVAALPDGRPLIFLDGSTSVAALVPDALGWRPVALAKKSEVDTGLLRRGPKGQLSVVISGDPVRELPLETGP